MAVASAEVAFNARAANLFPSRREQTSDAESQASHFRSAPSAPRASRDFAPGGGGSVRDRGSRRLRGLGKLRRLRAYRFSRRAALAVSDRGSPRKPVDGDVTHSAVATHGPELPRSELPTAASAAGRFAAERIDVGQSFLGLLAVCGRMDRSPLRRPRHRSRRSSSRGTPAAHRAPAPLGAVSDRRHGTARQPQSPGPFCDRPSKGTASGARPVNKAAHNASRKAVRIAAPCEKAGFGPSAVIIVIIVFYCRFAPWFPRAAAIGA